MTGQEVCDGTDLAGFTCGDFGFEHGTLTCMDDCSGFDTSTCRDTLPVLINEVCTGGPDWVELINLSGSPVDLDGWELEWWSVDGSDQHGGVLSLPSYELGGNERVLLQDDNEEGGGPPTVQDDVIVFHENIYWGSGPGAAALWGQGAAVDYVRWESNTLDIPAGHGWSDEPTLWPGSGTDAYSLSRVPDGTDTDTSGDFCLTPASPNEANLECGPGPGYLLITEIDAGQPDRIEIYNPQDHPVDLDDWVFAWGHQDTRGESELPSFELGPGEYVEVVDDSWFGPHVEDGVIHVRNMDFNLVEAGACGLVFPSGAGIDFVRWGGSDMAAPLPDEWRDQPGPIGAIPDGSSLGRSSLSDSDTASDWCFMPKTIGEPNAGCE